LRPLFQWTGLTGHSQSSATPQAETPKDLARRLLSASHGDIGNALRRIVLESPDAETSDMRADVQALRDELAAMIEHHPKFRDILGIRNPDRRTFHHTPPSPARLINTRFGQETGKTLQTLAHVATLPIREARAERALRQLEDWDSEDADQGESPSDVARFETLVILMENLAGMPHTLQERTARLMKSLLQKLPEEHKPGLHEASSKLPQSSSETIAELRTLIEQTQRDAQKARAAADDRRNRQRLLPSRATTSTAGTSAADANRSEAGPAEGSDTDQRLITYILNSGKAVADAAAACNEQNDFAGLHREAKVLTRAAVQRGIAVKVLNPELGTFLLEYEGVVRHCLMAHTDLTPRSARMLTMYKLNTGAFLRERGIRVPRQHVITSDRTAALEFMNSCKHKSVVVKPDFGLEGRGVSVDVGEKDLDRAIAYARAAAAELGKSDRLFMEEFHLGEDWRIVVIDYKVVAAVIRTPARVEGDDVSTIRMLIEQANLKLAAERDGEGLIPIDDETARCLALQGMDYDSVPGPKEVVQVRKNANTSTGGTKRDVTKELDPVLKQMFERAALEMKIPVAGYDAIVQSADDHVTIEVNNCPSLIYHEAAQPVEDWLNLLYPSSRDPRTQAQHA
jgi:D-alanine-D-alanine ligase-like ATP-grasp enzyme